MRKLLRIPLKAKVGFVKLKDFKKYLRGKSLDKLLHQARKSSLSRIVANENKTVELRKSGPAFKTLRKYQNREIL